jgi:hypothetical protein
LTRLLGASAIRPPIAYYLVTDVKHSLGPSPRNHCETLMPQLDEPSCDTRVKVSCLPVSSEHTVMASIREVEDERYDAPEDRFDVALKGLSMVRNDEG